MNMCHSKKYSVMTVGKLWRPQDSSSYNPEALDFAKDKCDVPKLSGMIDKWRNERKILLQSKDQQRKKVQKRREIYMKRLKQNQNERMESDRKMEIALQNTIKDTKSSDFLLEQLDKIDLEGHRVQCLKGVIQEGEIQFPPLSNFSLVSTSSQEFDLDLMSSKKGNDGDAKPVMQQSSKKMLPPIQYPEYFINKPAIEQAFMRLKKENEAETEELSEKEYFKQSCATLQDLYDMEMQNINTKGHNNHALHFMYKKFPPFPESLDALTSPANDPLIIFREWCHFHKLTPTPLKKVNVQSLLQDYGNPKAYDNLRLTSLCTLMNFYSEFQAIKNSNKTSPLHFSVGQESYSSLKEQYDSVIYTMQNTLIQATGKLKLGTALALCLVGKSKDQNLIIRNTLMQAISGITTTEKKLAALGMAFAGIYDHTPFHLMIEEWKCAEQGHVLQRYLSGLHWLSSHEKIVMKTVADFLGAEDMHLRLHTCLTLPFLDGNFPPSLQYTLRQMINTEHVHFLRHAAARALVIKGQEDCVHAHIVTTLSSANILRALEVIQLSLMLNKTDRRIAGVLLPCLQCDMTEVQMIALSVIRKLEVTDPMFISAVSELTSDSNTDVREAAFTTLSAMGPELGEVEPYIVSSLEREEDDKVRRAMFHLIVNGGMKGKQIEKALQKVLRRAHCKDDQNMLMELIQNLKPEGDDVSEISSVSESITKFGSPDNVSKNSDPLRETLNTAIYYGTKKKKNSTFEGSMDLTDASQTNEEFLQSIKKNTETESRSKSKTGSGERTKLRNRSQSRTKPKKNREKSKTSTKSQEKIKTRNRSGDGSNKMTRKKGSEQQIR